MPYIVTSPVKTGFPPCQRHASMSSIDDETLAKYLRTLKLENPDTSARAMLDSLHAMGCDIDLARVKKAAGKVVKALAKEKPLSPTSVVPQSASPVSRRGTPPTQKAVLKAEPAVNPLDVKYVTYLGRCDQWRWSAVA